MLNFCQLGVEGGTEALHDAINHVPSLRVQGVFDVANQCPFTPTIVGLARLIAAYTQQPATTGTDTTPGWRVLHLGFIVAVVQLILALPITVSRRTSITLRCTGIQAGKCVDQYCNLSLR